MSNDNSQYDMEMTDNLQDKDLCEILAMVESEYSQSEIETEADQYLYDLVDPTSYEEITNDTDAIDYLAEYFTEEEYKDWLIRTFL